MTPHKFFQYYYHFFGGVGGGLGGGGFRKRNMGGGVGFEYFGRHLQLCLTYTSCFSSQMLYFIARGGVYPQLLLLQKSGNSTNNNYFLSLFIFNLKKNIFLRFYTNYLFLTYIFITYLLHTYYLPKPILV